VAVAKAGAVSNKDGRKRADDGGTEDVGRHTSACVTKSLSFKRRAHRAGVLDATMTSLTCASTRADTLAVVSLSPPPHHLVLPGADSAGLGRLLDVNGERAQGLIHVGVGEARSKQKKPLCQSTWLGLLAQPVPVTARPVYRL
jgi:hypothetical protein